MTRETSTSTPGFPFIAAAVAGGALLIDGQKNGG
jgi:hypothetical protein